MLSILDRGRLCLLAALAACTAFVHGGTALAAAQIPAETSITRQAAGYTFTLKLPDGGVAAGAANRLPLTINGPNVIADAPEAALSMPAMAAMSLAGPSVSRNSSGGFVIEILPPHAGGYRLAVTIRPAGAAPVKVSFNFTVGAGQHAGSMTMDMSAMKVAGVAETQQASGTSWQPAVSPMYGIHSMQGDWMLMTHYNVSLNYDRQEGPRGGYQYNSTNWLMTMADRSIARDDLQLRTMLTLEPLTVTPRGYPLLFQSGEEYDGKPIVDRQHPHNFLMELAGRYAHTISHDAAIYTYLAPAGEPALGPTAFMHRASAMDFPEAPITHHWMDSTHVDYGVVTVGAWNRNVQLEAHTLRGESLARNRFEVGPFHLDSLSGRLSVNPGPDWSAQLSYGYLHSPESLRPNEDVRRTTLSTSYTLPTRNGGWWASTVALGNNSSDGINSLAVLGETEINIAQRNSIFCRMEFVNKLGEDLALLPATHSFAIGEITLGYVRDVTPRRPYQAGIGGAITFNLHPSNLDSLYGQSQCGFWLFLRIRPGADDAFCTAVA